MEITEISSTLSNITRVRLLQLLSDGSLSATLAHKKYQERFEDSKHRESIYRGLERLVEVGLASKQYSGEDKQLKYSLDVEEICLDLTTGEVEAGSRTE